MLETASEDQSFQNSMAEPPYHVTRRSKREKQKAGTGVEIVVLCNVVFTGT